MIERFATVKVKALLPVTDESFPDCFVMTRRLHMQGTVDSPMYSSFNHYWLVKHITSEVVRGVSIGRYGIYHEDELEIVATPTVRTVEEYDEGASDLIMFNDDVGFDYKSWDDVPD